MLLFVRRQLVGIVAVKNKMSTIVRKGISAIMGEFD